MKKTNKKIELEDLALMVGEGFSNVTERLDKVDSRLHNLEQGQEAIKLRLDNVAYRFEVKDFEKRIVRLEHKTGISK